MPNEPAKALTTGNDYVIDTITLKKLIDEQPPQQVFNSGFEGLDQLIGGFAEGDFVVVSGAQKSGKSTLCVSLTKRFVKQNIPVMWFSIELPYRQFLGMFGDTLPKFYVPYDRNNTSVEWIERKIKEGVDKYGIKVVVIDHLGLVTDEKVFYQKNAIDIIDARIALIAKMALKYRITIIAVAEHNKEALKKDGKGEMTTGGLRGTARLGYTASTIIGIERLAGVKTVRTWQEMDKDEAFLRTDMWVYIMDCRRTGARKIRIKFEMDDHGDLIDAQE